MTMQARKADSPDAANSVHGDCHGGSVRASEHFCCSVFFHRKLDREQTLDGAAPQRQSKKPRDESPGWSQAILLLKSNSR